MTALAVAIAVVGVSMCATACYIANVWARVASAKDDDGEVNAVGFHAEYGGDDDDS